MTSRVCYINTQKNSTLKPNYKWEEDNLPPLKKNHLIHILKWMIVVLDNGEINNCC